MKLGRNEKEEEGVEGSGEDPEEVDPLVRIARSLEKLASDPEVEIEVGPPLCPHCGAIDPEIVLPDQETARGPMSQLIIDASCTKCSHPVFIVIESYSVHRSSTTAKLEIEERERVGFFNNGEVR